MRARESGTLRISEDSSHMMGIGIVLNEVECLALIDVSREEYDSIRQKPHRGIEIGYVEEGHKGIELDLKFRMTDKEEREYLGLRKQILDRVKGELMA